MLLQLVGPGLQRVRAAALPTSSGHMLEVVRAAAVGAPGGRGSGGLICVHESGVRPRVARRASPHPAGRRFADQESTPRSSTGQASTP
jgi:hypothetical protein